MLTNIALKCSIFAYPCTYLVFQKTINRSQLRLVRRERQSIADVGVTTHVGRTLLFHRRLSAYVPVRLRVLCKASNEENVYSMENTSPNFQSI